MLRMGLRVCRPPTHPAPVPNHEGIAVAATAEKLIPKLVGQQAANSNA
jgi:hypothetical protein